MTLAPLSRFRKLRT